MDIDFFHTSAHIDVGCDRSAQTWDRIVHAFFELYTAKLIEHKAVNPHVSLEGNVVHYMVFGLSALPVQCKLSVCLVLSSTITAISVVQCLSPGKSKSFTS